MEGINFESRVQVFGEKNQYDRKFYLHVDNRQINQFNNNENIKFVKIKEINSIKLEEIVSRAD